MAETNIPLSQFIHIEIFLFRFVQGQYRHFVFGRDCSGYHCQNTLYSSNTEYRVTIEAYLYHLDFLFFTVNSGLNSLSQLVELMPVCQFFVEFGVLFPNFVYTHVSYRIRVVRFPFSPGRQMSCLFQCSDYVLFFIGTETGLPVFLNNSPIFPESGPITTL